MDSLTVASAGFLGDFLQFFWEILKTSGTWLMISFLACGLLHGVLRPEAFQKSLGNKRLSSVVKATASGMALPICSCGVLPLAVGLYRSGAYLGPTLAFLVATPIINPAALILSFALLGPQITVAYLICGFVIPLIIGVTANKFGGDLTEPETSPLYAMMYMSDGNRPPLAVRLRDGLKWGFEDLAVQTCRFMILGTLFAALIFTITPAAFIQKYLLSPDILSLFTAAFLGTIMYVCAVGHIPFIAALVGAGTAPGIALTFLLAGVATNIPEMISIWKIIGRRAVFIYTGLVVVLGLVAGYAANIFFAGSFVPQFDLSQTAKSIQIAGYLNLEFPDVLKIACASIILAIGIYAWAIYLMRYFRGRSSECEC